MSRDDERIDSRLPLLMIAMQDKKVAGSFGNIDGLVSQIPNKYLLVNTARVRAQQVVNGAEPLVEGANPEKAVSTAFAEIAAGKLELSTEPARPEEPPTL